MMYLTLYVGFGAMFFSIAYDKGLFTGITQ